MCQPVCLYSWYWFHFWGICDIFYSSQNEAVSKAKGLWTHSLNSSKYGICFINSMLAGSLRLVVAPMTHSHCGIPTGGSYMVYHCLCGIIAKCLSTRQLICNVQVDCVCVYIYVCVCVCVCAFVTFNNYVGRNDRGLLYKGTSVLYLRGLLKCREHLAPCLSIEGVTYIMYCCSCCCLINFST